jgi:morphogenetic protein associated with SpoVID
VQEGEAVKIHIVQKGDTLWTIAKKYNVNFDELKSLNVQLSSADAVAPGMKIKVPVVSTPARQTREVPKQQMALDMERYRGEAETTSEQMEMDTRKEGGGNVFKGLIPSFKAPSAPPGAPPAAPTPPDISGTPFYTFDMDMKAEGTPKEGTGESDLNKPLQNEAPQPMFQQSVPTFEAPQIPYTPPINMPIQEPPSMNIPSLQQQMPNMASQIECEQAPMPDYQMGYQQSSMPGHQMGYQQAPMSDYQMGYQQAPMPDYQMGYQQAPMPDHQMGYQQAPMPDYQMGYQQAPMPDHQMGYQQAPMPDHQMGYQQAPMPNYQMGCPPMPYMMPPMPYPPAPMPYIQAYGYGYGAPMGYGAYHPYPYYQPMMNPYDCGCGEGTIPYMPMPYFPQGGHPSQGGFPGQQEGYQQQGGYNQQRDFSQQMSHHSQGGYPPQDGDSYNQQSDLASQASYHSQGGYPSQEGVAYSQQNHTDGYSEEEVYYERESFKPNNPIHPSMGGDAQSYYREDEATQLFGPPKFDEDNH